MELPVIMFECCPSMTQCVHCLSSCNHALIKHRGGKITLDVFAGVTLTLTR